MCTHVHAEMDRTLEKAKKCSNFSLSSDVSRVNEMWHQNSKSFVVNAPLSSDLGFNLFSHEFESPESL